MQYAIEMGGDLPKYGVVHRAGCRDLRDPELIGDDWAIGVANLGSDWEMDVQDGLIHLAPCTR